jgi:hypothetical protein
MIRIKDEILGEKECHPEGSQYQNGSSHVYLQGIQDARTARLFLIFWKYGRP